MKSSLVEYTKLCNKTWGKRTYEVSRITVHHTACKISVERLGELWQGTRQASCNYGIGSDARVRCYLEEEYSSWCSSNKDNDNRAITIETSNCKGSPNWEVSDEVFAKLVALCTDICQRYGKTKCTLITDKKVLNSYQQGKNEMVINVHRMFSATLCPGPYLFNKLPELVEKVNKNLSNTGSVSSAPATETKKVTYYVQVGAYKKRTNADNMLKTLKQAGFNGFVKTVGGLYKVQVGAYSKKENAEAMLASLKKKNFDAIIVS